MHQLTPASVVVTARLRAAREKRLCPHRGIVGAVPRGRVRRAVPHVEDFAAGIGVRLTIRAVGTSDSGGVRKEVRHRSMARVAVAIIRLHSCIADAQHEVFFAAGRPTGGTRRIAETFPAGERGLPPGNPPLILRATPREQRPPISHAEDSMDRARLVGIAVLVVGLAAGLSGCRYYWYKPQTTAEAFARDNDACLQEARSATPATQRYGVVNQEVYRACLRSRGYQREKKLPPPTGSPPDAGYHRGYEFDD
jgi:hypothetical protein